MRTIETIEELKQNLALLRKYARSGNEHERQYFLDLVRNGTCFVFEQGADGDLFAPSRFIGYASNSWQKHDGNSAKNGGPTNKAIAKVLGGDPVADRELERRYREFCTRYGFQAPATGSFGKIRKYWRLPSADSVLPSEGQVVEAFEREVSKSLRGKRIARLARLAAASPTPKRISVTTFVFQRNPDVVAEVLTRAQGRCECCLCPAPFVRVNGAPYLEVHHKIQLAAGGSDTVENAMALCPNCHRECHFGR